MNDLVTLYTTRVEQFINLLTNDEFNLVKIHNCCEELVNKADEVEKEELINKLEYLLTQLKDTNRKVFIYSVIAYVDNTSKYVNSFIDYVKQENALSSEKKYFIWQQIASKKFNGNYKFNNETCVVGHN